MCRADAAAMRIAPLTTKKSLHYPGIGGGFGAKSFIQCQTLIRAQAQAYTSQYLR
jgi:hypothetical protein